MEKGLYFLALALLVGCNNSFYHVASVESPEVKLTGNDFTFENEQLLISYNFWEKGGRMRFLVVNKTDQPLYIDWGKSFLERNDSKTLYTQLPPITKRPYVDTVRYAYRMLPIEPYRLTARTEQFVEIPPKTSIAIADFPLQQVVLHKKKTEPIYTYTRENSPLRLGHQIVYSMDKDQTTTQSITHSFWINEIRVVKKRFGVDVKGQPNRLYAVEKRVATTRVLVIAVASVAGTYYFVQQLVASSLTGICC